MNQLQQDAPIRISRRRVLGLSAVGAGLGYLGYRIWSLPGGFRINTVEKPTPAVDPAAFRLVVDGAVERPATFTLDEFQALPSVKQISDFHCVEGWGVDNVRWEGVRFQTLAEMVGAKKDATFVTFYSEGDVYKDSLSISQAMLPDVILAYSMWEKPLEQKHGYPLRLIMPRMYGYKGPKWLKRVEFVSYRVTGYWEQRGWQIDAWIDRGSGQ
ncbi:MAG: molybdopterin-dependent oxidoreductase [Dehalococcoidia bacterium]